MINKDIEHFIQTSEASIMIPKKDTSMVFEDNALTHAMLILKQSNYTQIPVLDYDSKFKGLISLHHIYRILGEELFNDFDKLNNYKVKDFIDNHYAIINENYQLEDVMNLLINYNFINVVSDDNKYIGMITRSAILKNMNFLIHNTDKIIKKL